MAQKREKSELRKLIDERGKKDLSGVQGLVKELTAGLIQEIMDAELEDELVYSSEHQNIYYTKGPSHHKPVFGHKISPNRENERAVSKVKIEIALLQ